MTTKTAEVTAFSPYTAAKQVNTWLSESGVEKVLPPQMFYNYTVARARKGKAALIPGTEFTTDESTGKVTASIPAKALREWFDKYAAKQTTKA